VLGQEKNDRSLFALLFGNRWPRLACLGLDQPNGDNGAGGRQAGLKGAGWQQRRMT
jgi:hypothetical protein